MLFVHLPVKAAAASIRPGVTLRACVIANGDRPGRKPSSETVRCGSLNGTTAAESAKSALNTVERSYLLQGRPESALCRVATKRTVSNRRSPSRSIRLEW